MIDPELRSFLERPIMILVAAADRRGQASIGRGVGVIVTSEKSLDVFVSRLQWPVLLDHLLPGAHCALTTNDPVSYRTFQLKGIIESQSPSTLAEQKQVDSYIAAISATLADLGVSPHQIPCWFTRSQVVRLSLRLTELYSQTPGPTAGARMASA